MRNKGPTGYRILPIKAANPISKVEDIGPPKLGGMSIQKAIEIQRLELLKRPLPHEEDRNDALKLGIEALEFKLVLRKAKHPHGIKTLPSETEK